MKGVTPKRLKYPLVNTAMEESDYAFCKEIIRKVMEMPIADPFLYPVSKEIEGYYQIIKNPMDFSTIATRLDNKKYKQINDFMKDIKQVYENSCKFNGPESILSQMSGDIVRKVKRIIVSRPERKREECFMELGRLSARIRKLLQLVPDEYLDNQVQQEIPLDDIRYNERKLDEVCGEKKIRKVYDNWNSYNGSTKEKILKVMSSKNNKSY